jgi:ABC-type proline/glycine betaine transport system ATPase subunit
MQDELTYSYKTIHYYHDEAMKIGDRIIMKDDVVEQIELQKIFNCPSKLSFVNKVDRKVLLRLNL